MTEAMFPAPTDARAPERPRVAGLILLASLVVAFLGAIVTIQVLGTRIVMRGDPQLHAIEQIGSATSGAHLAWLEAWVTRAAVTPAAVTNNLSRAQECARACLRGGTCPVGQIQPLGDTDCRNDLTELQDRLAALHAHLTAPGALRHETAQTSLPDDDLLFVQVIERARRLEAHLRDNLFADQRTYAHVQTVMAVLALLLATTIGVQLRIYWGRIRAAQQRLYETEERFSRVVDQMPVMVVANDEVDRPLLWNRECERITGYGAAEMVGNPWAGGIFALDPEPGQPARAEGHRSPGDFRGWETEIRCKDGSRRMISWSDISRRVPVPGWAHWIVGVDVTQHHRAMQALRASETRYAELIDNLGDAVAVYQATDDERDFVFREFNRAAERIDGVRRQDLLGRSVRDVFPAVEALGLFGALQRVYHTGRPERLPLGHYRDHRLDGWRDHYVYRLPTDEVVVIYTDETERVRVEHALEESEDRFRAMFETARDGIFMMNEQLKYTQVNSALSRFLQRPVHRLLGRDDVELFGPEIGAAIQQEDRRVLAGEAIDTERNLMIGGSEHRFHIVKTPQRNEQGEVAGVCGIARDMTEFWRVAGALERSEARFRAITETGRDVTAILNAEGRITYISPAILRITGSPPDELLGRRLDEAFSVTGPESQRGLRLPAPGRSGETMLIPEVAVRRRDGGTAYLEGAALAMPDVPGIQGTVVSLHDVTERHRTESELRRAQKMEAIGTLASGIAHDFNNILYAILGYSELARDDMPSRSPARESIEQVLQAGRRATGVVRRLLTVARQGEEERRPLALAPVLEETLQLLRSTIPTTIHIEPRLEPCGEVLGDPTQIQQMMINLCTNACQAMLERNGRLGVELEEVELTPAEPAIGPDLQPGRYACIIVRDDGCGMDADTLERIFEPYFSTRITSGGTGLGLAMVHGIIRHHRGAVRVESTVGEGTTFRVYLPLREAGSAAAETEEQGQWRAS
jgi:PAS domain S-box-containing protein